MRPRIPWLTLAMFVLTSGVTALMLLRPDLHLAEALERDPRMLQGEGWRFGTTWFVLTDGWMQILVNSLGLLIYGGLVERIAGPLWWLIAYVGAGLVGEAAGIFWQPVGGGNSVAICGLIGLFSVWQGFSQKMAGPPRVLGIVVWGGLGLWLVTQSDIHGAALVAGFVIGGLYWLISGQRKDAPA
ncbi:MAG: rhomboid family intramembrane serine protease [Devosia sp.]